MVNQTQIDFGRQARDRGMEKARAHADAVVNDWSERAYELLKWFLERTKGSFMAEDFRADVKGLLPEPPTNRAYGSVVLRASREGLIRKVGHGTVKSATAHRCFASIWQRSGAYEGDEGPTMGMSY